jgi:DNA-binding response OmpR family regulator
MNNTHLHIIGSKPFYNLLNELDPNYTFSTDDNSKYNDNNKSIARIIFVKNVNLIKVKRYLQEDFPTIFVMDNHEFLKKNKLQLLQFHVSLIAPLEFLSFREILNILITKYSFFKQSKIIVNNYEIDSNQRVIIKKNIQAKLTEKELQLILILNDNNGLDKSFLLRQIWNRSSDLESHAFETHLHRLRKKINKFFKDKNFIIEKNSKYYLSK